MPANLIDVATLRMIIRLHVDGARHRRFSADPARRRWYADSRTRRYSRYLDSLAK